MKDGNRTNAIAKHEDVSAAKRCWVSLANATQATKKINTVVIPMKTLMRLVVNMVLLHLLLPMTPTQPSKDSILRQASSLHHQAPFRSNTRHKLDLVWRRQHQRLGMLNRVIHLHHLLLLLRWLNPTTLMLPVPTHTHHVGLKM
jgi:hypothetical protein